MRLLFLLPFPPDPRGEHGASRMTGQLLEGATGRHEVGAIYLRAQDEPPIAPGLESRLALAIEVRRPGLRGPLRRALGVARGRPTWVTDWAVPEFARRVQEAVLDWHPQLVQAELSVMGQYLKGAILDRGPGERPAAILVDYDPGAATATELAGWERGLRRAGRRIDAAAWRRFERRVFGAADAVVVFTDEDRARIATRAPATRVRRITPGVDRAAPAADPGGQRVVFVGGFAHPPNVEAALRLGSAIFPAVRARVPGATLEIVGGDPPAEVRALAGQGVTVTGRVPDTRPYLDGAAVVVAPLRLGGGMRVKVLEALAAGKALVATPRAVAGIDLTPGDQALVAETDAELAEAIATLLADPERRRRLGAAAHGWAAAHLDWPRTLDAYDRLYASLTEGSDRR